MKASLVMSLIFLSSGVIGCSSFPSSQQEMEKRAGYESGRATVQQTEIPGRRKQRVEEVCMGGRLLPSGDWFMGGRLLLVVNEPEWIFDDPKLKKRENR
jgi:hypothetical protein